jgi:hypothetical protein
MSKASAARRPNSILIYISAHGFDGYIYDAKDPLKNDQSMARKLEPRIRRKLALDPTISRENPLCKLFIGEIVGKSGICSVFTPKGNTGKTSQTEHNIEDIYRFYNDDEKGIKNLRKSNHFKYQLLGNHFKYLYRTRNLQTRIKPDPEVAKMAEQNKILESTGDLMRSFTPLPFQRDKMFQLGPNQDEIVDETHLTEHYGVHLINVEHEYLSPVFDITTEPFPNDTREEMIDGKIVKTVDRVSRQVHFMPDRTSPFNMNEDRNQNLLTIILEQRLNNNNISSEDYEAAITILDSLVIRFGQSYPKIYLSKLWVLFDILGFDEVYIIDSSCRELYLMEQTTTLSTGKKIGAFDLRTEVNTGSRPDIDPLQWTEDPSDVGPQIVTRAKEEENAISIAHLGGKKTKRKTQYRKRKRKTQYKKRKTQYKKRKTQYKKEKHNIKKKIRR